MRGRRILLAAAVGAACLLLVLRTEKPFGQETEELALHAVAAEEDGSGAVAALSISGTGFDRRTRLFLTPEFGNRQALLHSQPTWGNLQGIAVAGNLVFTANHSRGMQVFDFSDPARPRQIGTLQLPGMAYKIALQDRLAVVAAREKGLQVVDAAEPQNLRLLGAIDLGGNALDVALAGHIACVGNSKRGLQVVTLRDPARPELLATLPLPGNPYALTVADGIAYVAAAAGGLQIVAVDNPRQPRVLAQLPTPTPVFGIALQDGRAWLAAGRGGLLAVDVRDPRRPHLLGAVDTPGTARAVAVQGDFAYVADNMSGLQVVAISDPRKPLLAGAYAIPGQAQGIALCGRWALVAGSRSGLQVVDLQQPPALPTPAASDLPTPPDGKLQYLANLKEVLVIATSESRPAKVVGRIPLAGVPRRLQERNDLLYVLTKSGNEAISADQLEIFDIGEPARARPVNRIALPLSSDLLILGNNLWTAGREGLCRFDLAEPASPTAAGCLPLPDAGFSLARQDDYLLVGGKQGGLHVFDVTQPALPRRLGTAALPWHLQAFATSPRMVAQGALVVVAGGRNGLLVYRIADPTQPEILGGVQLPNGNFAADVTVSGDIAYVSDPRAGLHLVDIGEPRQPQLLATIANQGTSRQGLVAGKEIVFAATEGLRRFPLPIELTNVERENSSHLRAKTPGPISPGTYTLWAVNRFSRSELPGALVVTP